MQEQVAQGQQRREPTRERDFEGESVDGDRGARARRKAARQY